MCVCVCIYMYIYGWVDGWIDRCLYLDIDIYYI